MPACSHADPVVGCPECSRAVEPAMRQSCLHEQPGGPCAACAAELTALGLAPRTRAAVAPTPPPLGRVALVPPEDAATLAVLRAALADPWVAQQCRGDAEAARYVAEGHEERLAALGIGLDADRHREAARLWRAREALSRAVLRLIGEVER